MDLWLNTVQFLASDASFLEPLMILKCRKYSASSKKVDRVQIIHLKSLWFFFFKLKSKLRLVQIMEINTERGFYS